MEDSELIHRTTQVQPEPNGGFTVSNRSVRFQLGIELAVILGIDANLKFGVNY